MHCPPGVCRLLDVDAYSFDFKLSHIAKHVQLPAPPTLPSQAHLPREDRLPPLIVVNMQMPDYPVSAKFCVQIVHNIPLLAPFSHVPLRAAYSGTTQILSGMHQECVERLSPRTTRNAVT
jgi:hypothetical protein